MDASFAIAASSWSRPRRTRSAAALRGDAPTNVSAVQRATMIDCSTDRAPGLEIRQAEASRVALDLL